MPGHVLDGTSVPVIAIASMQVEISIILLQSKYTVLLCNLIQCT